MEDEVVIIEVVPKMFDVVNTPDKFSFRVNYIKEMYDVNQPITRRPEYLAVRDPVTCQSNYSLKSICLSLILKRDSWFLKANQYFFNLI